MAIQSPVFFSSIIGNGGRLGSSFGERSTRPFDADVRNDPHAFEDLDGVWACGWNPYFRIPVMVAFVSAQFVVCLLPAQKSRGHLDELLRGYYDGGSTLLCLWRWSVHGLVPSVRYADGLSSQLG